MRISAFISAALADGECPGPTYRRPPTGDGQRGGHRMSERSPLQDRAGPVTGVCIEELDGPAVDACQGRRAAL